MLSIKFDEPRRQIIAIVLCVSSATVAMTLIAKGRTTPFSGLMALWVIWSQIAEWLGHRLGLLRSTMQEIAAKFKSGQMRLTGVARAIHRSSNAFLVAAIVSLFFDFR
jgi:hypothetical protein